MNKEKNKIPVGAREKLPFWLYPVWATNGTVMAIGSVLIGYATFYCTDVLGLSPAIIGIIMLIVRCTDGITDVMVGYLIDNTRTKWGQARPYEIATAFVWIFMIMFFATPDMGTTGKLIWVFVLYFLITAICQTIVYGEDKIYMKNAIPKTENQNKLISFSGSIMMFVTIVVSVMLPQLVQAAGKDAASWKKMIFMIGIPCVVLGLLRMILVPECKAEEEEKAKQERITIRESVRALFQNKYIMIFVAVYFLLQTTVGISNACGTYFAMYYIGDIGVMSFVGLTGMIMPLSLLIAPWLISKLGTRKLLILGAVCGTIAPVIRIFTGKSIAGLMISNLFASVFQLPVSLLLNVYVFECMEYGEWKTGLRIDGVIGSMNSIAAKLAAGLTSVGVGFVLGLAHYDGTLAVQPASAVHAIWTVHNVVPFVLCVAALIFAFKYDLEKQLPVIRKELAERRQGNGGIV